ncbi:MAG: Arm DNA-binding domain-containing protein [Defluviicoccus sp.]|nr:Arm DNA-binding domain-containing protein [Defluviicoccus sp.]
MARLRRSTLSNRVVDRLPVREREAFYWDRDLPGFGVRVYPSGTKVYLVQGNGPGGARRVTVGRHGTFSADAARRRGAELLVRIRAERKRSIT